MRNNITSPEPLPEEKREEFTLRPRTLKEFIGQKAIKENLAVFIKAARQRHESLDHTLLYGPPGLGKTTLAYIIANELNVNIKAVSAPAVEKPGDLAAILTNLSEFDVLFIDEIHRLHPSVEEILYSAMEDFSLDIIIGQGASARSIKIKLPPFTLVGATVRAGLLTSPLRDRFGIIHRINFYPPDELALIVERTAKILGIEIDQESKIEIAKRSRGTPRIANRLVRRIRDFAQVEGKGKIDIEITRHALERLNVDKLGLDEMDRRLLETIIVKYKGGPVGLDTIAVSIGEDPGTIEDVYEPFLIQIGLLKRTPRGRVATEHAFNHLGIKFSNTGEQLHFNL